MTVVSEEKEKLRGAIHVAQHWATTTRVEDES